MAIISRQTSLLAAENWKKLYQTFREADFSTYDFETLRKSMIDYLKLYYPEDFNDFTESSEFIALIDLIAFLGQSLAFRTDLNARENFLDTAERRDSVLKLAKLISYNPKRAISASGFLKIDTVNTTENVYDSNGINLSGQTLIWNDPSNDNWLEQFTVIFNACLVNSQLVGRPGNSQLLNGIMTDEYSVNLLPSVLPIYKFDATVEDQTIAFESVSASSVNKSYVYEVAPKLGGVFNILYRNDNLGNSSNNTGFFFYFKQGNLASIDFSITDIVPNKTVNINVNNINNADGWLYSLDSSGNLQNLWTAVPAVAGINVIYNSSMARNLYQVNSKAGDQVDLIFGDGAFANIPQGKFRYFYRTANGLGYKITPESMRAVTIKFNYVSRTNRVESITFRASLEYTVANAASRESIDDIKQKAPQQYYTQNRMITGEDYNILPYTTFSSVTKVKALNRTSIGLSKYLDMLDTTGNYSSTNMFGQDGVLYRNTYLRNLKFSFLSPIEIRNILSTTVRNVINSQELLQFYYANFPSFSSGGIAWHLSTTGTTSSTGYFTKTNLPVVIGGAALSTSGAKYLQVGATIRFTAPTNYYFNSSKNLVPGQPSRLDDTTFFYATITEVLGDGTNRGVGNLSNGIGPVTLNVRVPTGALVNSIIPVFKNYIGNDFTTAMVELLYSYKNFGLSYNAANRSWLIVYEENLKIYNTSPTNGVDFSLTNIGSQTGTNLDASWLVRFEYDATTDQYITYYRGLEYIFHSPIETNFFFDKDLTIFDSKSGKVIRDNIKILKTNPAPNTASPLGEDALWYVHNSIVGSDGYASTNSIYVTFSDTNNDGVPDNAKLFEFVVDPDTNKASKYVFFKSVVGYDRFMDIELVDNATITTTYTTTAQIETNKNYFSAGQILYATTDNLFYQISSTHSIGNPLTDYIAYFGRQNLYYQYRHNTPSSSRIDPSTSNIIDLYVLTANYNTDYRNWMLDNTHSLSEPVAPTNISLETDYAELNNKKAISDTIIFQSAKFKPIFGNKSTLNLQATFKVVKNPGLNISDADIKTSVVNTINIYFAISNWDFGDTFYFSELAAYLHRSLSPNIASIIIVPNDDTVNFGSLYQINAEANEIIISSATVDDVQIITAVTAGQLNQSLTASNRSITF
jgi:hypothetical protein